MEYLELVYNSFNKPTGKAKINRQSHRLNVTKQPKKANIVLDVDKTLIQTIPTELYYKLQLKTKPDYLTQDFAYFKRREMDKFLRFCFKNFKNVALWSLGSKEHIDLVIEKLFKIPKEMFAFVWTFPEHGEEIRTKIGGYLSITYRKNLRKIWTNNSLIYKGFRKQNTLMIEDTPSNCRETPENCLSIQPFEVWTDRMIQRDQNLKIMADKLKQILRQFNTGTKITKAREGYP
uniref:FCP1 homology domain-containing protein n=1 Tax=viral metagenome TaxID=1070528 RepID=A0A6C0CLI9_9ZZZZ